MFFDEEIDSGSRCIYEHPIKLVAEGYGYCTGRNAFGVRGMWAWRFSPPAIAYHWEPCDLENGKEAWVSYDKVTKSATLALIREDMEAHRNLPFDEEAERARLMPV